MNKIRENVEKLLNSDLDIKDRMFMMLTCMVEAAVVIVLIADIIIKENRVEIITLGVTAVVAPIMCFTLIRKGKIELCRILIALGAIFISSYSASSYIDSYNF